MRFKYILIISMILLIGMSTCVASSQVTLSIGGKSFTIDDLSDKEIENIQGNGTSTITINSEDGKPLYMITKATEETTILNELLPEDNITTIEDNGITYQNIVFSDGTPSMTVFTTEDGSIYEIVYYNGNDFLLDYKSIGSQLNQ